MGNIDVIVGLQWGSEGKGKLSAYLSYNYDLMIRSGGPQAGHTFYKNEQKYINRQIPCGVLNNNCLLAISPAGLINLEILIHEIQRYNLTPKRLFIDKNAMVITKEHIKKEINSSLKKRLASTCEGVGAAQIDKIWRRGILFGDFVKDIQKIIDNINDSKLIQNNKLLNYTLKNLKQYSKDVVSLVHSFINENKQILVEGTQGFGLCLNHGNYPFVTSKDVTVSSLLNDIGVSPKDHNKTIGVLRTYPIRVGGNSGPTNSDEINWEEIKKRSNANYDIKEFTTVTNRLRRVFEQDYEILKRAIMVNKPDELALMFIDYINVNDFGKNNFNDLSNQSKKYIFRLEKELGVFIKYIGTGPKEHHMIERCF